MKKIILYGIMLMTFSFTFASECNDFYYGKVCVKIQNQGNGNYKLVRELTNQKPVEDNLYIINCEMLLPNGKLKDMGVCNKTFQYDGTGTAKVKFYVNFQGENGIISYNYNFQKSGLTNGLTSKQYSELQSISKMWPRLIEKLKSKYPKLSRNSSWINKSDSIYDITIDYIDGKDTDIESYYDYEKLIKDYIKYTIQLVK